MTTLTTGTGLSSEEMLRGLIDYGLFGEKIPPCFSTEGLTDLIPKRLQAIVHETDEKALKKRTSKKHDYVRYESLRDVNVPRQLGIPHPESYIVQCLALMRHWNYIKTHCSTPIVPVSRTYVQRTSSKRVFLMNYKGSSHFTYEEDEIRSMIGAHYFVQADISNCFPGMYTHSIPWAMHGRQIAKKNRSILLAGNLLDRVTQNVRDGQTNGLLIGPNSSNIMSEIILTCIDNAMLKKNYLAIRHIDDYKHYARTYSKAEEFIRELTVQLREYELVLNERKTKILPMPVPLDKDWVRELRLLNVQIPKDGTISFSTVRSFMESALQISQREQNSAVLNYAIKMIPDRLNLRAKRLFSQHMINLTVLYPYLAQLLDVHIFAKHHHRETDRDIEHLVDNLLELGVDRIYPDTIAYGLYYAIKYDRSPKITCKIIDSIIEIDDCLTLVLLLKYAKRRHMAKVVDMIQERADSLKGEERQEKDRYWLLIYQAWNEQTLRGEGQDFLADLKKRDMSFLRFK